MGEEQNPQSPCLPWVPCGLSTVPALLHVLGLVCEGTLRNDSGSLPKTEIELQRETNVSPDVVTEAEAESNSSPAI